jgi:iron-sulfur cluster assembly accessory protein
MIIITDSAAKELLKRTEMDNKAIGVRLSITSTGCSGHQYKMEHVYEESKEDDKYTKDGATLYVPMMQSWMMAGTTIDYLNDKLESRFNFVNPNADSACGCGESFSIKSKEE